MADAVVIGGGITGTNVALQLAQRGLEVSLLERSTIAAVQSGHSAAMIGTHRGSRIKVQLAAQALPIWHDFATVYGVAESPFRRTGRVYLYGPDLEHAAQRARSLQRTFGCETDVVDSERLRDIDPQLDGSGASLIVYEPGGGVVDPAVGTRACADAARRAGARITEHTAVQAIRVSRGRVVGVETSGGPVACSRVVVATSAWTPRLLRGLGLAVPIEPRPAPALYLRRTGGEARPHVTVSDLVQVVYARDVGSGISMVGGEPESADPIDPDDNIEAASWDTVQRLKGMFGRLFPTHRDSVVLGGNRGLYDVTPDGHPIVDHASGIDGLFVVAGFSGDGYKYAPVLGQLLAEWVVDGRPSIDLRALRLSRFVERDLNPTEFPEVGIEGRSNGT
jgi:sarcosine oxidase subunit beta